VNPNQLAAGLLSRIEDAGLNASAPPQQRWLDGWILRLSPGKAQRARCVNAVAAGCRPQSEKLAEAQAVYRAAGLRLLFRVTPFTQPPDLDDWLTQRGWQRFNDTRVMVCPALPRTVDDAWPSPLSCQAIAPEAYAHIVGEFRGTKLAGCEAHAQRLRHSPVPYISLVLRDARGQVLAGGQCAVEAELAGLYDVFTVPAARGQGLSRRLCAKLLSLARVRGARVGYLQVDASNVAARAVYRRLGFGDAYAYHYRALPSAGD
jgi:ribosomal protein S18 acetylase RimI-like enzyme